jgi:spermidine/putrescine transport system substrate-binding protein
MILRSLLPFFYVAIFTLACTPKQDPSSGASAEKKTLNLFIWANYVSSESIKEFEKESNLKVNVTHYASNEELLAKLQAGASGYDVVVPSDYMVTVMVQLGLLEPLQAGLIPNKSKIDPRFLAREYDAKNEYSLPYGWASTGIAFNKKYLPEGLTSWKELLENPKLKGHVGLLDDTREVYAIALKVAGQSLNSKDEAVLAAAQNYLLKNKAQIKSYLSDPMEAIGSGEVWATQIYSPDAMQARAKTQGQVQYVIPSEGCTFAIDNLVIPKTAQNKEGAHKLINFLLSAESNRRFVQKIFAGPVLTETKAALPPELQKDSGLFPADAVMNKMEMLKDLGATTAIYDRLWTEFKTK